MWIANRDLNLSTGEVLEAAEKFVSEGTSEEQAKWGALDHMCMQLEWDAANLHRERLGTS